MRSACRQLSQSRDFWKRPSRSQPNATTSSCGGLATAFPFQTKWRVHRTAFFAWFIADAWWRNKSASAKLPALCSVVTQNPGTEAWIVGEGAARPDIERIIQSSGVSPQRVKLIGRVEVSKIYSVLRDCHAFVLLSDYEGLPVSMLEAMAAGVVPVCLDMRSGIRDAIKPGVNGVIVKDREEGFFAAIRGLRNDTLSWSGMSTNARETIEQEYSEEKCSKSWIELLSSFDEGKRGRPFKAPFFFHLPRRNPKFGSTDFRPSISARLSFQVKSLRDPSMRRFVMRIPLLAWLLRPIRKLVGWMRNRRQQALIQATRLRRLAQLTEAGSTVHPSLEFKGRPWSDELFSIGSACDIEQDVFIWFSEDPLVEPRLNVGNRVFIGRGTYLGVHYPISLGDNTIVGAYSYIISANHRFDTRSMPIRDQGYSGAPVRVGDDVWIGTHVVILPGVTIGKGAIVGAGSIVNRDIPEYEIWQAPRAVHQGAARLN